MNRIEIQLLDLLKRGRDAHGVVSVKAEFEAEGTRPDEFNRLLEIAQRADVKVALKIGGCEAVSDLLATHIYGIDYVIAPMVETPYALSKFIDAKNKTHGVDEQRTEFLFNLETETTLANLEPMIAMARSDLDGVVFGRVDFTLSCGMPRTGINDRRITECVLKVARACSTADLDLVVGGSVTVDSVPALREIRAIRLDRFETRKVIFDGSAIDNSAIEAGIANAAEFELIWLLNKRSYYERIAGEDNKRIGMMEARMRGNASRLDAIAA